MDKRKEGIIAVALLTIIFSSLFISAEYTITPGLVPPANDRILQDVSSGTPCSVNLTACDSIDYVKKIFYGLVVSDTEGNKSCLLSHHSLLEKDRLWLFTGTCAQVKEELASVGYCYDSDGGKNSLEKGHAFANTDTLAHSDFCKDSATVNEQICIAQSERTSCTSLGGCQVSIDLSCESGYECKEGACSLIGSQDGTNGEVIGNQGTTTPPTNPPQTPPTEYTCVIDSDCVKVKTDCCDCAHDGNNTAINKSSEQAWLNSLSSKCSTTNCAQMVSTHWTCNENTEAICASGKCVLHEGSSTPTTCAIGTRKSGKYCGSDGKEYSQLEENAVCENNWECESNLCTSGKCVGVGFLQRIFDWFKALFSGEMSIQEEAAPTYSNIKSSYVASQTEASDKVITFSITWNDETSLAKKGVYILSTNLTGTWKNNTPINFTSTPQSIERVETWKPTYPAQVGYRWYAKDNAGNWKATEVNSIKIESTSGGQGTNPGVVDTIAPTFSNAGHNTTLVGKAVKFSVTITDETDLIPNGQYIFSTNNSGSWVNESSLFGNNVAGANPKTKTVENVKVLTSTTGAVVGYRWYANDTAGNWNASEIYSLTTTQEQTTNPLCSSLNGKVCESGTKCTGEIKDSQEGDCCVGECEVYVWDISCEEDVNTIGIIYTYDPTYENVTKLKLYRKNTEITKLFSLIELSKIAIKDADEKSFYKYDVPLNKEITGSIEGPSCPAGFIQYKNWSRTENRLISRAWYCRGCNTGDHQWRSGNLFKESCTTSPSNPSACPEITGYARVKEIGCIPSGQAEYIDKYRNPGTSYTYYLKDGTTTLAEKVCTTKPREGTTQPTNPAVDPIEPTTPNLCGGTTCSSNQFCNSSNKCQTCTSCDTYTKETCGFNECGQLCDKCTDACDWLTGKCVECTIGDNTCSAPTPYCTLENKCVQCNFDWDCSGLLNICRDSKCIKVDCLSDPDCINPDYPLCSNFKCVECNANGKCDPEEDCECVDCAYTDNCR